MKDVHVHITYLAVRAFERGLAGELIAEPAAGLLHLVHVLLQGPQLVLEGPQLIVGECHFAASEVEVRPRGHVLEQPGSVHTGGLAEGEGAFLLAGFDLGFYAVDDNRSIRPVAKLRPAKITV
jgi:hypothetical protein